MGLIASGAVDAALLGLDIGFAAHGSPPPPIISGLELVLGGVANIVLGTVYIVGGIIQTGNGSACGGDEGLIMAPVGFAMVGLGSWFFGRSLWGLATHEDGPLYVAPTLGVGPGSVSLGLAVGGAL